MASTAASAALAIRSGAAHRMSISRFPFSFGLTASENSLQFATRPYCRRPAYHRWRPGFIFSSSLLRTAVRNSARPLNSKLPVPIDERRLAIQLLNQRQLVNVPAARGSPATEPVVFESSSPGVAATTVSGQGSTESSEKPSWTASIDFKWIRENRDAIAENIRNRKSSGDVDVVVQLYEEFVRLGMEVDKLRAERNAVANAMKGKMEKKKREELISQGKQLKDQLAGLEAELDLLTGVLQREGQRIPNMTHPSVPLGSEECATVRKTVGSQRQFSFPVKDHLDLGLELDLFDFEAAAEVSGNKFYYLKNEAVLLEMALVNWTLAQLLARGFILHTTPDLVRSNVVEKCGFQPRGQNTQVYSVEGTDLCLAGTAEIPLGGLYMDSMIPEASLPLRLVAFSHCFRTEAGAAGSSTRGLYRVHQFSKVEMFVVCRPERSDAMHEELIGIEEDLYTSLGLHFRTLDMSSEDLGAPAYRKYDIEAWMPGLGRYGEISSASNCTDYQARRLNVRYRPTGNIQDGPKTKLPSPRFAHTLNATACAVPRMIIAILENNQQADGSILVPAVLQPFMGGLEIISPKSG